jgi:hypothetical protein
MTIKWLSKLQRAIFGAAPSARAESDSKAWLNDLRQDELSLGAAMRRGEHVTRAPGVLNSSTGAVQHHHSAVARSAAGPSTAATADETATSIALGLSTGNPAAGVAAGSLAGGMVGASLHSSLEPEAPRNADL